MTDGRTDRRRTVKVICSGRASRLKIFFVSGPCFQPAHDPLRHRQDEGVPRRPGDAHGPHVQVRYLEHYSGTVLLVGYLESYICTVLGMLLNSHGTWNSDLCTSRIDVLHMELI